MGNDQSVYFHVEKHQQKRQLRNVLEFPEKVEGNTLLNISFIDNSGALCGKRTWKVFDTVRRNFSSQQYEDAK